MESLGEIRTKLHFDLLLGVFSQLGISVNSALETNMINLLRTDWCIQPPLHLCDKKMKKVISASVTYSEALHSHPLHFIACTRSKGNLLVPCNATLIWDPAAGIKTGSHIDVPAVY